MKTNLFKGFFRFAFLLIILLIFGSCTRENIVEENGYNKSDLSVRQNSDKFAAGYIIVLSSKPAAMSSQAASVLNNLSQKLNIPDRQVKYKYKHTLTGFAANLNPNQLEALKHNPLVEFIKEDQTLATNGDITVQDYPTWGLDKIDQREIKMDRAYTYTATGKGVTAYIIDSGINYSHEEFEGRASNGHDFVLEEDPGNTDPNQNAGEDCLGHGTHVAATVGGKTFGVAKEVKLVSVRVFGCIGSTPESRVIAAVDWVTANAIKPAVVNMSLGGPSNSGTNPLDIAIQNSIQTGINYVIAAGNSRDDACLYSPAKVPEALTVGASDIYNRAAYFSNYGDCVDLYAPGVNITSASNEDNTSSTEKSGTSMASPHVAGVVALYLEKNNDSSPEEVSNAIIANSTSNYINDVVDGNNNFLNSQWGQVSFTPPDPPNLNLKALAYKDKRTITISLTWDPTNDEMVEIYKNGIKYSQWYNEGVYKLTTTGKGDDVFQICELSYVNCSETITPVFVDDPSLLANMSPIADFGFSSEGLKVNFWDGSTDPDGSIQKWSWDFGDGSTSNLHNPSYTYKAEGIFEVSLVITDDRGGTDNKQMYIKVQPLPEPQPVDLQLSAEVSTSRGRSYANLSWTPSGTSDNIEIYRNGSLYVTVPNDGNETLQIGKGSGIETIKVCIPNSAYCSNEITVEY
ncbi:hypothetical protein C7S20_17200 [Christiangramia fulva]|uniref:PKD domain-containing protein n=1 Tax=Christiangramia fulva TaxID=2126553 RepID=A0A2R3Z9C3_9FLAO|nr:S8 family serine peptidase [Christiangramia fulva]AVR46856.1 hypothetical protein C7S20_17200 [Christiangramia fulva]